MARRVDLRPEVAERLARVAALRFGGVHGGQVATMAWALEVLELVWSSPSARAAPTAAEALDAWARERVTGLG